MVDHYNSFPLPYVISNAEHRRRKVCRENGTYVTNLTLDVPNTGDFVWQMSGAIAREIKFLGIFLRKRRS
jgi:hypothetical protein